MEQCLPAAEPPNGSDRFPHWPGFLTRPIFSSPGLSPDLAHSIKKLSEEKKKKKKENENGGDEEKDFIYLQADKKQLVFSVKILEADIETPKKNCYSPETDGTHS